MTLLKANFVVVVALLVVTDPIIFITVFLRLLKAVDFVAALVDVVVAVTGHIMFSCGHEGCC